MSQITAADISEVENVVTTPSATVRSATFSDETELTFSPDDIVVLVGPNNSGKSVALRELERLFRETQNGGQVVIGMGVDSIGSESDVIQWLGDTCHVVPGENKPADAFGRPGAGVRTKHAQIGWTGRHQGLSHLAPFFCQRLDSANRTGLVDPPPNIDLLNQPPAHPIHILQNDDSLEREFSKLIQRAFGVDLVIDKGAGNNVPVRCGIGPTLKPGEHPISNSYLKRLRKLPLLHEQGDGMKSFVGVLLNALSPTSVALIDEPEAFLHPPQARYLGELLAKRKRLGQQLFLATHSGDFLRGLLDSGASTIRVIRLEREGDINRVSELQSDNLRKLWNDSLLRYSNILDGVFHEKVIVCESDSDCRFYAALYDAVLEAEPDRRRVDVMFAHCGGKDRIQTGAHALRAVSVPVAVVADFDMLRDEKTLQATVESLGGDWNSLKPNWKTVKQAIDAKKPEVSAGEVSDQIRKALPKDENGPFPETDAKAVKKILNQSSPWSIAKTTGVGFVPNGDPSKHCKELLQELADIGLYVVEIGELECWCKEVGGHGPGWVSAVLKRELRDNSFQKAREFASRVIGHGSHAAAP